MNEDMNDAFDRINDEYINEATQPRRAHPVKIVLQIIAAVLALIIGWCAIWMELKPDPPVILQQPSTTRPSASDTDPQPTSPDTDPQPTSPDTDPQPTSPQTPEPTSPRPFPGDIIPLGHQVGCPEYPEMPRVPVYYDYSGYKEYNTAYQAYQESIRHQYAQPEGYADSLEQFFRESIPVFLSGEDNRVYSPLNVYLALAMAAETADGQTRQQILNLLQSPDTEALRTQAGHVWNAHYRCDGKTTSLLGSSLWMDDACPFREDTIQTLADRYYASAFHGDLGTEEMDKVLADWLNQHTGNLLTEYTKDISLSDDTVFALATTAWFSADWEHPFYEDLTATENFYTRDGAVDAEFMQTVILESTYYRGSNFGAIMLPLSGDNQMWILLPDEGRTPERVLSGTEYWELIRHPDSYTNAAPARLNVYLPKFDVSSQTNLIDGLKKLGVRDAFEPDSADFSNLTDRDVYITTASHAARVMVDEDGVDAAAYTLLTYGAGGLPEQLEEVEFRADRPFFFAITSADNLPLFTGIVKQP